MTTLAGTNFAFLWTQTLEEGLHDLAGLGLERAELTVSLPHLDLSRPTSELASEAGAAAVAAGITYTSLNPVDMNLISATTLAADATEESLGRCVDLAHALGIDTLVVVPGRQSALCPMEHDVALAAFRARLERLLERASARGVRLALENTPFGFLQTPSELLPEVERLASDHLGLTVDAANLAFIQASLEREVRAAGERLFLAHISDTTIQRFAHAHLGDGVVDYPAFLAALESVGYTGPTVNELVTPGVDWPRWGSDVRAMREIGWC